jgi:hypothetical protein
LTVPLDRKSKGHDSMAENDSTQDARRRKPPTPPQPIFRSGEVYLWSDLKARFHSKTLKAWQQRRPGLVKRPKTQLAFVLSDDLIALFATWEESPQ